MFFSVVIPVFNGEKYLRDCLESVLGQTFNGFEVIVVDDGSTDSSGAIADEFADAYRNVHVLHCQNQGPFLARRTGIGRCTGEYVVCVDADDKLREDALERVASCCDEANADIIAFRFSRNPDYSTKDDEAFLPEGVYEDDEYRLFERAVCAGLSNSLCGKAIRLCHIDVDAAYGALKSFRMGEDLFQLLPIVDSACSFVRLEDCLYYYRPNEASSTGNFKHTYIEDTERVAKRLLEYGERWGMADEAMGGVMRLYVGLSKMLADSAGALGKGSAKKELALEQATFTALSPSVAEAVDRLRPDYRALLRAVLAGNLTRLRLVTEASHLGRRVLGRSI